MTAQTPAAPQLTNDEFDELIDRINAHHQAKLIAVSAGRPKPAPFVMPAGFEGVSNDYSDLPQDSIDAFAASRDANASQANGQTDHISSIAEDYRNEKISEDSFDDLIDKQKQENIDKYTKDQNDTADKLKASGHAHPEKQSEIAQAFSDAGDWIIDNLWTPVKEFFQKLAAQIEQWWNKVVSWFGDAVDSLKSWWHGLFG
ncbi:hypothetical protein [Streptomyces sp. Wh19]|uniref:hypothetical protein n=1 Tax=Streptomyces sp. Wh19 TaxID=3076629 RepID=UPI0029588729|nr:hypothetical protein [Streptomyces sp. Wh19]MDV9198979.1 hypothetical protein [Streptomyces sp. Wh19]